MRDLKARGQRLRATFIVGKEGLSERFLKSVDEALERVELVKVKFGDFKEQKKELAPQLAEKVAARLVMRVGNVALLFRRKRAGESPAADI